VPQGTRSASLFLVGFRLIFVNNSFQGVSAVDAFYQLLSQDSLSVMHPEANKSVAPVEMCPILKTLYKILIKR
jgi:hypothetical protein